MWKNIVILSLFLAFSSCSKIENQGISAGKNCIYNNSDTCLLEKDSANSDFNSLYKQVDSQPDYVPPKNGGNNKKWYCYRNKVLMKDSNCYFGKGFQKRNRYRQGW